MTPRIRTVRFNSLRPNTIDELKQLTIDPRRGDLDDDGRIVLSQMYVHLIELRSGIKRQHDCWAIIARFGASSAGWCILERGESTPGRTEHDLGTLGFYVDPAYRRQGLGRALLEDASRLARDKTMTRLMVQPWNERGKLFFQSVGFVMPPDGLGSRLYKDL